MKIGEDVVFPCYGSSSTPINHPLQRLSHHTRRSPIGPRIGTLDTLASKPTSVQASTLYKVVRNSFQPV
jgi:hypothetical protein